MLKVGPCTVVRSYIQIHDVLNYYKNNNKRTFHCKKNYQLLTLSSSTEEIFHVQCQNRPVATLPTWLQQSTFVLRHEKCHYQSHWMRNFRFFFSYFGFLPILEKFERQCLQTIRIFSFLTAIIRENSDKRPWIENGQGFTVHSSTQQSGEKGEWRANSWLAISNTREKISYLFTCVVTAFLRAGNPSITP